MQPKIHVMEIRIFKDNNNSRLYISLVSDEQHRMFKNLRQRHNLDN